MKLIKIAVSLSLGLFFMKLALGGADFSRASAMALSLNPLYLLCALFTFLYTQFIRSTRWYMLLNDSRLSFLDMFKVFYLGLFANYVIPFRLGEFARPAALKKMKGSGFTQTLGVVFVERIFDLGGQAALLLFVLIFAPLPFESRLIVYMKIAAYSVSAIAVFAVASFLIFNRSIEYFRSLVFSATGVYPALAKKIDRFMLAFNSGALIIKDKKTFFMAFFYTMVSWFTSAATIMFALNSAGINLNSPFLSSCFIQAAISIALVIPPPPGFVGTFHYFCMEGLKFYSIDEKSAFSFALIFHALQIFMIAIPGIAFMVEYGLKMGDFMTPENEKMKPAG